MKQARSARLSVLISGVILFAGCARGTAPDVKAANLPVVGVAEATYGNLAQKLVLTAEFKPYQEVDVHAKVAGYVKSIRVDVGDRVRQGELLAVLDIPELQDEEVQANATLQERESELERTRSAYQAAHLEYSRLQEVVKSKPGLVAQQEVDNAMAKDQISGAQVSSADHDVEVARAAHKRLETLYAYSKIIAPFDGVITKRYADTGAMIQAGTSSDSQSKPLVRVSQNSLLRLIVPVSESAVPRIHVNTPVEVTVPALKKKITGKVARFADTLDLATRTMSTEIDVPNPQLELIPGMYAEATITLDQRQHVLTVPVEAIAHQGNEAKVYVVGSEGAIEEHTVQVGIETATTVEITAGLKLNDLVVVSGRGQLHSGEQVTPKKIALPSTQPES